MQIPAILAGCILAFTLSLGMGCKPAAGSNQTDSQVTNPTDSLEKNKIVKHLETVNLQVETAGQRTKIPFPILNENDSIDYYTLDGKLLRVSMNMDNGEGTIWPTYFLQDDQLIHVRLRKLVKDSTNHYAQEIMAYLKDGKIFYIEERQIPLQPGEIPALLRLQPYTVSQRTFSDMEKEYMEYWPALKQAVDTHLTSSSGSN